MKGKCYGFDSSSLRFVLNPIEMAVARAVAREMTLEKERRMAGIQSINPLIKKLMAKNAGAFQAAKGMKNPYAGITCPDGTYYGQVKRLRITEKAKKGQKTEKDVAFEFTAVIICCADASELHEMQPGDTTYSGEQVRPMHVIRASEKRTAEEAFASFMYDLQDFGIITEQMVMHEGEKENSDQFTIEEVCEHFNTTQPYCRIVVSTDATGQYRNANLRGMVEQADIDALVGDASVHTNVEVTEDESGTYEEPTEETTSEETQTETDESEATGEESQEVTEYEDVPPEEEPFDSGEESDGEESQEEPEVDEEPAPTPPVRKLVAPKPPIGGRPAVKVAPARAPVKQVAPTKAAPAKMPVKAPVKQAAPQKSPVKTVPGKKVAPAPVKRK